MVNVERVTVEEIKKRYRTITRLIWGSFAEGTCLHVNTAALFTNDQPEHLSPGQYADTRDGFIFREDVNMFLIVNTVDSSQRASLFENTVYEMKEMGFNDSDAIMAAVIAF